MQDAELLRAYAESASEPAFQELVRRYVDLAFSTAVRRLGGDARIAEEVVQSVFLLVAQRALLLSRHPALGGWIYRTSCHLADRARRTEERRRARELEAMRLNAPDDGEKEADQLLPMLDEALQSLSESDRMAVVIRYLLKQPMRDVGSALGVSEAAAKMRVGRAIERLRQFFVRRGIACTSATLGVVLSNKAVVSLRQGSRFEFSSRIGQSGFTGLQFSGLKPLILSQTKTTILVGIIACAALLLALRQHFKSARETDAARAGIINTETTNGGSVSGGRAAKADPFHAIDRARALDPAAVAIQRLHAALVMPIPKSGISWPSEEVIQSVAGFADKRAAFSALKAAIDNPEALFTGNLGVGDPADLVRGRAIHALQGLLADVPEVRPYLWELYKTDNVSTALSAFTVLKSGGFKPDDITALSDQLPKFSQSPAFRLYVPQAIADVLSHDREAVSTSAIRALETLLENPVDSVRWSAASALASTRLDADPRIGATLAPLLTNREPSIASLAVQALEKAGPKAAGYVPALLELAKETGNKWLRDEAYRSVNAIQPAAASSIPEVGQLVSEDARAKDLGIKLTRGTASLDELLAAAQLPQYATLAAAQLGDMGSAASRSLPVLRQSLEGKDEDAREKIVESIYKIDPQAKIERVDSQTVMNAVINAEVMLGARGNDYEDPLTKLIMERRAFSTWWTKEEAVSFVKKVSALDPAVGQAFVDKVAERDPAMGSVLKVGAK